MEGSDLRRRAASIFSRFAARLRTVAPGDEDEAEEGGASRSAAPDEVSEAVAWAQRATVEEDWQEAVSRWSLVLRRFGSAAPVKAHVRLALAHRELGDMEVAEGVLRGARERFPDDVGVAMEWALLAMVEEDWQEAISRWGRVFDRFRHELPPKAYARMAISHREAGEPTIAAAIIERGRRRFPDDFGLAMEWAQLAMVEENWAEAVDRWSYMLERFPDSAPPKLFSWLAIAYREQGDFTTAAAVLSRGRRRFPDDITLESAWAQFAMEEEDWPEAFRRWEHVIARYDSGIPAKAFARLAVAYRRQGELERARSIVERGRARFPEDVRLAGESAQVAMAESDWVAAVTRWRDVADMWTRDADLEESRARFPRRGSVGDWFEIAWRTIVSNWERISEALDFVPQPRMYRTIARTLRAANLHPEADHLLKLGLRAFPTEPGLAFDHALTSLGSRFEAAEPADLLDVANDVSGVPEVAEVLRELAVRTVPDRAADAVAVEGEKVELSSLAHALVANEQVLRSFAPRSHPAAGLGPVHVIRVPDRSSLELQIKAGRFFSRRTISQQVEEVSERDRWEEMHSTDNEVLKRARRLSDHFGERFEDLPFLPADALSDAVLFLVKHEICLYEPMRRIAHDVAVADDGSPVFIECPTTAFRYLDGYTFSQFDVVYLYFELRRAGVNAFLCVFERESGDEHTQPGEGGTSSTRPRQSVELSFRPSARAIAPRGEVKPTSQVSHPRALIPAGIRSISRVSNAVGPALLYSSGSVVKEFAYDRSISQDYPIEPEASFYPPMSRMSTFRVPLWPAARLSGFRLDVKAARRVEGTVEASSALDADWLAWLNRAVHDFLKEMSIRCVAEVDARGISEAHICDHIFTEPSLFASAVKRRRGRVVLWPHSANPVHVEQRRESSFDEVHAVTRAGAQRWRDRFPDTAVVHSPSLMLDPPVQDVVIDPNLPISVVVIGGRSTLGHMPVLDRRAHERSYKDFFAGLGSLRDDRPIEVYFKPRGHTGEHEMWLHDTVGSTADWRPVLEHPMRIRLPNLMYVSISMGSSALLEGLSRGIPGLVVRDFPVRDYTTLDPDAFPTLPTSSALALVRECSRPGGLRNLLERELRYYRAELHG